jgi:chromatin remodeling complex protein RSC6
MEGDDAETVKKIEEAVLDILKGADMATMTEAKVRAEASERLGLDLSVRHRKKLVRSVVESFLESAEDNAGGKEAEEEDNQDQGQEGEEEEEEEEENDKRVLGKREYECDDSGDPIICAVSCSFTLYC